MVAGMSVLLLAASAPAANADTTVTARLEAQNNSGASGSATLTATNDGRLTVVIRAQGLVPGQPHAQHVHGTAGGSHFMCPSMANDKDGDGYLTNEEATGEYGTIFLSLTTSGDASPDSGLAVDRMPVADASGNITYKRTFAADDVPAELLDNLSHVHVVQHGIDVNDNDRYDLKGLGESTFAKNLGAAGVPEEATNPATCGVVTGAGSPTPPRGGPETGGGVDGAGSSSPLAPWGGLLLAMSATLIVVGNLLRRGSRSQN
jgi:hypothetical protein